MTTGSSIKKSPSPSPSPVLIDLIEKWADSYMKSMEVAVKIIRLGEETGIDKLQIRELIEAALLRRGLSERRIREIIPRELKYSSKTRENVENFAALSGANDSKNVLSEEEEDYKIPDNLPVTTPETIIHKEKSEAEILEDLYRQDSQKEIEEIGKRAEVQQLIDNHILLPQQIFDWVELKYKTVFQIPKNIEITKGAYHQKLSPSQAVAQLKQLINSVKSLEIGWRIIE